MNRDDFPINIFNCDIHDDEDLDTLEYLIRQAREGHIRLVVVDEDIGLAHRYADPERDQHIDADRGNWDVFADNFLPDHHAAFSRDVIGDFVPEPARSDAVAVLAAIMVAASGEPGGDLSTIAAMARQADVGAIRTILEDHGAPAIRDQHAMVVQAVLNGVARRFVKRDPDMPRVSLERWADADPGPILFITAHAPSMKHAPRCAP